MKPFIKNVIERECIKASVDQTIAEVANVLARNSIGAIVTRRKRRYLWHCLREISSKV